jgi:pimeloyl-ACP methyl ester carboxylesterase
MKTENIKWFVVTFLMVMFKIVNVSATDLISTRVVGKGEPMILIHGMACAPEVWDEFVERYKDKNELHLVRIKGFGNDEKGEADHYLEEVKNELIAYVKDNNLQKPILIGHSMGGFLGLWAAAEASDLFGKIVSVDGVPYFPVLVMPGITPETAKAVSSQMTSAMANMEPAAAKANQEMMIASMIATEAKRPKVVEMGIKSNPAVLGQAYGEMYTTDIRPMMEKITVPVLVFGSWAAYEPYGSTKQSVEKNMEDQLKGISNHKLLVAERAYHFVFYDEPEWFYSELDKFLN